MSLPNINANKNKNSCGGICPCNDPCPIQEAVSLIGGKWKMRILCSLTVDGKLRYNDMKQKTRGITPAMLSTSLKELEAGGLVTRTQYPEIPVRVEYSLTEHGKELWPILHRLAHWARNEEFDSDIEVEKIRSKSKVKGKNKGR